MSPNYDYEDGLRDHCVDDPLWAADEIERLRGVIAACPECSYWATVARPPRPEDGAR